MIADAGRLPAIVVQNCAAVTWMEANEPSDDAAFLSGRVQKVSVARKWGRMCGRAVFVGMAENDIGRICLTIGVGSRGKTSLAAKSSNRRPMRGRLDSRQGILFSTYVP